jgi:hypothetical protein
VRHMRNSYGLKRKGVDLSQGPPKRKRGVVQIPAVIDTPLMPAENAPSSSGWHNDVVLLLNLTMNSLSKVFSWAFPSYMLKFDFSFVFFNFVWVLIIFLDSYNHDSLLSSQSIERRFELPTNNFPTLPFSH